MVILPKFLYLFCNIPIPLTKQFFKTIQTQLLRLIWGNKQPRISWLTLTQTYSQGRFTAPDFYLYYLCAQAQYAFYWFKPHECIPPIAVEDGDAHLIPFKSIITHTNRPTPRSEINPIDTMIAAWQAIGRRAHITTICSRPPYRRPCCTIGGKGTGTNNCT